MKHASTQRIHSNYQPNNYVPLASPLNQEEIDDLNAAIKIPQELLRKLDEMKRTCSDTHQHFIDCEIRPTVNELLAKRDRLLNSLTTITPTRLTHNTRHYRSPIALAQMDLVTDIPKKLLTAKLTLNSLNTKSMLAKRHKREFIKLANQMEEHLDRLSQKLHQPVAHQYLRSMPLTLDRWVDQHPFYHSSMESLQAPLKRFILITSTYLNLAGRNHINQHAKNNSDTKAELRALRSQLQTLRWASEELSHFYNELKLKNDSFINHQNEKWKQWLDITMEYLFILWTCLQYVKKDCHQHMTRLGTQTSSDRKKQNIFLLPKFQMVIEGHGRIAA